MRVNTDELQRQADELRAVARRINDIQDSVLRVARNLGREQFGERFRYPLNNAANAIGKRSDDLKKMRTALQQIARLYEQTEMQVTDEAEHASVHHEQDGIGSVTIPDVWSSAISVFNEHIMLGPDGMPQVIEDWPLIPNLIPVGVTGILHNLIAPIGQGPLVFDDLLDSLEAAFQEQYGVQWISEGSARRLQMLGILEEAVARVEFGEMPDLDELADRIAQVVWNSINPDGDSGYRRIEPPFPTIQEPIAVAEFLDDAPASDASHLADYISGPVVINENVFRPLGPSSPTISAIDADAGIENIAGDAPIMGAIDWTPWNP